VDDIFGCRHFHTWGYQDIVDQHTVRAGDSVSSRQCGREEPKDFVDQAVEMWKSGKGVIVMEIDTFDLGLNFLGMFRILREIPKDGHESGTDSVTTRAELAANPRLNTCKKEKASLVNWVVRV
jgi:hypothetical protein